MTTSKILAPLALLVGWAAPSVVLAGYDAAADFSATTNPNGVWSYGQEPTLGGTFSLLTTKGNVSGIDYWNAGGGGLTPPEVFHNGTSQAISYSTITIQPGQLAFHPGPQDQFTTIRFTSPVAGSFSLASSFTGIDVAGTTTDVHVLLNGTSLFGGLVNGYGNTATFDSTITLNVGDILDFEVGYGTNNNYTSDSTGISAVLTPSIVPEPASITLLAVGLAGACHAARRRKQADAIG